MIILQPLLLKPRPFSSTFFNSNELLTSIVQGIIISAGALSIYQYAVYLNLNENMTRTMVFPVLITANIFLTLVNRSFYYSILATLKYRNNLVMGVIAITIIISSLLIFNKTFSQFFEFQPLTLAHLSVSIGAGFFSVIWYELVKWRNRKIKNDANHI